MIGNHPLLPGLRNAFTSISARRSHSVMSGTDNVMGGMMGLICSGEQDNVSGGCVFLDNSSRNRLRTYLATAFVKLITERVDGQVFAML
jgi:hypothetical protein